MSWNSKDKTFTGEISDCGRNFRLNRIWEDACDVGIDVESHKTQAVATFYLSEEKRDRENDLMYLEFRPTAKAAMKNPKLYGVKIILFND